MLHSNGALSHEGISAIVGDSVFCDTLETDVVGFNVGDAVCGDMLGANVVEVAVIELVGFAVVGDAVGSQVRVL